MCVALPIVGAWSMAVLLWQLFEYYYEFSVQGDFIYQLNTHSSTLLWSDMDVHVYTCSKCSENHSTSHAIFIYRVCTCMCAMYLPRASEYVYMNFRNGYMYL